MRIDLCAARNYLPRRRNFDGQTNQRTKASEHVDEPVGTNEVDALVLHECRLVGWNDPLGQKITQLRTNFVRQADH